jgi:serine protease Do
MRKFITFGPAMVVLLAAVVTLLAAPATMRRVTYAGADATMQLARANLEQDNILKQIDRAVRSIAEAVEPSVVHIGISQVTAGGRVFKVGPGSGWVFDDKGHIVTNAHVVRNARQITVQFFDGRAMDAEIVGQDPTTDIAVLKVDTTEGLFPVQRATGIELHQGERVFAFGSPFGFKFSMSEGIVSATGRDPSNVLGMGGGYTNFIQTDAAVNPGNSGGPLVNVEGKLVGMNVAIATAVNAGGGNGEGQNSGISFAIPLETIERVVGQVITTGTVNKGYLGINHARNDEMNERLIENLKFAARGVLVTDIEATGPAAAAGLRGGDVITRFNNRPTPSIAVLRSIITNTGPGESVTVEVVRDGETREFKVTLGELTAVTEVEFNEAFQAVRRFGIESFAQTMDGKLLLAGVIRSSRALRAGLRPGMIVSQIDGQPVANEQDFYQFSARNLAQGRTVKMTVTDDTGQEREVELDPRP